MFSTLLMASAEGPVFLPPLAFATLVFAFYSVKHLGLGPRTAPPNSTLSSSAARYSPDRPNRVAFSMLAYSKSYFCWSMRGDRLYCFSSTILLHYYDSRNLRRSLSRANANLSIFRRTALISIASCCVCVVSGHKLMLKDFHRWATTAAIFAASITADATSRRRETARWLSTDELIPPRSFGSTSSNLPRSLPLFFIKRMAHVTSET